MDNKAVIMFRTGSAAVKDLEVPLDITSEELIRALNVAYSLGIPAEKLPVSYLKAENPTALIHGEKTLEAFGVHDGTSIHFEL